ncbi:DNA polymerase III subunit gamma/tau [Bordetella genomosp. 9]|uniref:DNA-directed DNA polymerase n=1 Tax=Bordetella genomosp. 9 TaxID=1416803 RepID=A0A261RFE4_9BORD|nr:DNA polymerase III subunit gamma/tau [Bordetella genomosp. 9]OZI23043.1 DNA polymerase III subunit gamma/tau [Bordetella genomosp. 9]
MTYLVLARKWRPRSFDTLVGQDHVVRALTHALDTQRLHHAWLFTGTRGVGKTTLSRILAKSLNCETGVTSKPCGVCQACTEIDAGRFVDYLELDAASNRGVDEMTQLLEQAVYSPGAGRFKVYMIDEVHMLTGHAFNAMLKTLEEPPPHVKFILATTDPQKIPVTVLSRCLQFNLKQMPPDAIVGHLRQVLGEEQLAFEVPALRLIAQAASGSMRDALSLTDQAIAYSAGNLTEEAVRGMLGTIDQRHLVRLLDALGVGDARAVLAVADELATRGLSYGGALADLAGLLSRVAIEQRVAGAISSDDPLAADIARLAHSLHPDALQLFYSVAVHSRGELALAPDEYAGFVMACLRMLSLSGDAGPHTLPATPPATNASAPAPVGAAAAPTAQSAAAQSPATPGATQSAAVPVAPAAATPVATPAAVPASVPAPAPAASPSVSAPMTQAPAAAAAPATPAAVAANAEAAPPEAGAGSVAAPATPSDSAAPPASGTARSSTANLAATPPASAVAPRRAPGAGVAPWEDAPAGNAPATAASTITPTAPAVATGAAAAGRAAPVPVAPAAATQQAPSAATQQAPTAATQQAPSAATQQAPSAATPQAPDDGPPAWVDEAIPDDAEGGYESFSGPAGEGFIASPDDDDFETMATGPGTPAAAPPLAPARRAPASRAGSRRAPRVTDMSEANWPELAARLPVTGLAAELARQSEWQGVQGDTVILRVAVRTLADSASRVRLQTVLCEHFGQSLRLDVLVGATGEATAHAVAQQERAERQKAAEAAVDADPFVQVLLSDFGGQVVPGSIRHVDPPAAAAR